MTAPLLKEWSVSAQRLYRKCSRAFWLSYVQRVPGVDSRESIRGQVLHEGLAAGWSHIAAALRAGENPSEELYDVVFGQMEHAVERHDVTDEELDEWVETVLSALKTIGPHPEHRLHGVEIELHTEFDGVPMKGRLDVAYDDFEGVLHVDDAKSSKKLPRRDEVLRDTQLGLNALLAARHLGRTQVRVAIASIGAGVAVEVDMPRDMATAAAQRVADTARAAEADTQFLPRRGEACADCKVRQSCPLFATGPVPEPEGAMR